MTHQGQWDLLISCCFCIVGSVRKILKIGYVVRLIAVNLSLGSLIEHGAVLQYELRMPIMKFCGKARASRPSESCLSIQDVLDLTQNTLAIVTVSMLDQRTIKERTILLLRR